MELKIITPKSIASKLSNRAPKSKSVRQESRATGAVTTNEPVAHYSAVCLRGMPIHKVSRTQTVGHIMSSAKNGIGGWVVTPNLDILRRYKRSVSFRNLVATSSLNVADGMPLVWASRVKGQPLPERVNGTDLMVDICEAADKSGNSVFMLGGNPGCAEKTVVNMKDEFPGLRVAGYYCPEFGFESNLQDIREIAERLRTANPDIVFVGLGSPKQDVVINMLRLQFPGIWWLGVGVSFSFLADELIRAPNWAKNGGLEWLYRLFAEPKRLAKRYLIEGLPFFATTIFVSAIERIIASKKDQPGSNQTSSQMED